jgi:hypothetical protein
MTLLTLILLPWKKVSSANEARRLTHVGAAVAAVLALVSLGQWWFQGDAGLLTSPVVNLILAATLYLGYRTSAVAFVAFAFIDTCLVIAEVLVIARVFGHPLPDLDTLDYLTCGADMLVTIAYWLGAGAAIRGTFGLAASERQAVALAGQTSSHEAVVSHREPAASPVASGDRWTELEKEMLRLMDYPPKAQVRPKVVRAPVEAAPVPKRTFSGRVFVLKLASVLLVLVGTGVGLAMIALVMHYYGEISSLSHPVRHEREGFPDVDRIMKGVQNPIAVAVLLLAAGFWVGIFLLGFMPFLQLARRLWAQAEPE